MPTNLPAPDESELATVLGPALPVWREMLAAAETVHAPLARIWRSAKTAFGRMCLLQHKGRTLLYLTPDEGKVWVAVVLGERSYQQAMAGTLPGAIKELLAQARPYVEGRGIRFPVDREGEGPVVAELMRVKG
ncbi:DUF3788 family protein [Mesoterricola silvestris]|uniref:Uncharacterized protein n=1 Tax=Mesoterricola silvestris TaxID=2927979 RepID=A0AA48K953_9BACT|nr:DUF3788 family protein [Mesoterricola silvestris]BDU73056.1 hypothetical protein METEAL_22300 [Mesoterricola silvestris]